jgi:uncharacterized protein YbgA (DUF1722 family)
MKNWAQKRLKELNGEGLGGFVFKSNSPSSGMRSVKVHTPQGMPGRRASGIFAKSFMERFPLLPVEDDIRLHDPALRENFIERVFVFHRIQKLPERAPMKDIVAFHTDHRLLIMSHSPSHLRKLGKIVANPDRKKQRIIKKEYLTMLMDGLRLKATVKKNINVLNHIMGHFKKLLESEEKQEILEFIDKYRRGLIPLIVPITLLNHYVRKYHEPYLKRQHYLNPPPRTNDGESCLIRVPFNLCLPEHYFCNGSMVWTGLSFF